MKVYESMIIVKPDLDEAAIAEFRKGVEAILTESDVKPMRFLNLGVRDLAYDIAKEKRGRYFLVYFEGKGSVVGALSRHLKLAESCLRHMVVLAEGKIPDQVEGEASGVVTMSGAFEPKSRGGRREGGRYSRRRMEEEEEDEDMDEETLRRPARKAVVEEEKPKDEDTTAKEVKKEEG